MSNQVMGFISNAPLGPSKEKDFSRIMSPEKLVRRRFGGTERRRGRRREKRKRRQETGDGKQDKKGSLIRSLGLCREKREVCGATAKTGSKKTDGRRRKKRKETAWRGARRKEKIVKRFRMRKQSNADDKEFQPWEVDEGFRETKKKTRWREENETKGKGK
ncbi:uncharacterized protein FOMMEDRAFT_27142 [Fomitiporia mediterranea MF3/22]|uniref:uncharacterized protein n=1 Tax=Fomitiporia mediterranea (strain MF3/22) TaxID=694068 RepID=UPI00044099F3|nr:uncharacterized protein FOMMEDRAFT_27142 [Fomitiporia mediterranea MF3/22]EJD04844.1 hypothetical protein FOMMEDRAFT_27142 [Fomitiporia mediterranea MF3/22]